MPARKNRPEKHGVGALSKLEIELLRYWFTEGRNTSLWVGTDDVVHGVHGFDAGNGGIVRGLVTKGYLERREVKGEPDWEEGANIKFFLTEKGRKWAPNATVRGLYD